MGYYHRVFNEDGSLKEIIDTRTLEEAKEERIGWLKIAYGEAINEQYPAYKQSNVAMGLLHPAEAESVKLGIQNMRLEYDRRKRTIQAATTLAALDAIVDSDFASFIALDDAKQSKVEEITAYARNKLNSSQFTWGGHTFNFTPETSIKANGLATMGAKGAFPDPFSWTDATGTEVPMTDADFNTLGTGFAFAVAGHNLTIETTAKVKAGEVMALATVAEVLAYDASAGW